MDLFFLLHISRPSCTNDECPTRHGDPTLLPLCLAGPPCTNLRPPGREFCTDYALDISYQQITAAEDFHMEIHGEGRTPVKVTSSRPPALLYGKASLPLTGDGYVSDCTLAASGSVDYTISGQLPLDENGKPALQMHVDTTVIPLTSRDVDDFLLSG
ncbi:MAG: hypothetical protein ACP5QU_06485 [Anaerolineae bacterium]